MFIQNPLDQELSLQDHGGHQVVLKAKAVTEVEDKTGKLFLDKWQFLTAVDKPKKAKVVDIPETPVAPAPADQPVGVAEEPEKPEEKKESPKKDSKKAPGKSK